VTLAPGCRLLGRARTVTEARGAALLRLDDEPALDALTAAAQGLEGKPLVMAMLLEREGSPELTGEVIRRAQLRPVRGVDPGRRAIVLGSPLREGDRIAFAALDSAAARQHLDQGLRDLQRRTAGGVARFGLYLNCAGRGLGLHGAPDVDAKLLRARFAGLPIAGLMSSFEVAPIPQGASLHFYTGVFALFTAPS
jgi:small ligand-binding sensory domain FIST